MMTKNQVNERDQMGILTIKQLVVIGQCTNGNNQQKIIQRNIWQYYLDMAEDLRHHTEIKEIYER